VHNYFADELVYVWTEDPIYVGYRMVMTFPAEARALAQIILGTLAEKAERESLVGAADQTALRPSAEKTKRTRKLSEAPA